MKRRALLLLMAALPAFAAPPQVNLTVELRWVDAAVSGAALAGVREGGLVVGTAGSVSPRPGGFTASTRRPGEGIQAQPPLLVLNGKPARMSFTEQDQQQTSYTLDFVIPRADSARPEVIALLRERPPAPALAGFALTPTWPGGRQPAQVDIESLTPGHELLTTVQAPLGDWVTVARRGSAAPRPPAGTVSSHDAAAQPQRELQLRVQLAP